MSSIFTDPSLAISVFAVVFSGYSLYQAYKANLMAKKNLELAISQNVPEFIAGIREVISHNNGDYSAQLIIMNRSRGIAMCSDVKLPMGMNFKTGPNYPVPMPFNFEQNFRIEMKYPDNQLTKLMLEAPATSNERNSYFKDKAIHFQIGKEIVVSFKDELGREHRSKLFYDEISSFSGPTIQLPG